jgi:uncharacterized membrane protein (DUF373 family)
MLFPLLEGMAARIGYIRRVILVFAVILVFPVTLGELFVCVPINFNHDRLGAAVVSFFPILAVVYTALHHWICHSSSPHHSITPRTVLLNSQLIEKRPEQTALKIICYNM